MDATTASLMRPPVNKEAASAVNFGVRNDVDRDAMVTPSGVIRPEIWKLCDHIVSTRCRPHLLGVYPKCTRRNGAAICIFLSPGGKSPCNFPLTAGYRFVPPGNERAKNRPSNFKETRSLHAGNGARTSGRDAMVISPFLRCSARLPDVPAEIAALEVRKYAPYFSVPWLRLDCSVRRHDARYRRLADIVEPGHIRA